MTVPVSPSEPLDRGAILDEVVAAIDADTWRPVEEYHVQTIAIPRLKKVIEGLR